MSKSHVTSYTMSYYIKMDKTSWTQSIMKKNAWLKIKVADPFKERSDIDPTLSKIKTGPKHSENRILPSEITGSCRFGNPRVETDRFYGNGIFKQMIVTRQDQKPGKTICQNPGEK